MSAIGIILVVSIALFAVLGAFFVALWVYKDCRMRGLQPGLWIIIILVNFALGLILYFVIGRKEVKKECRHCSHMIPVDARYCERCGNAAEMGAPVKMRSPKRYVIMAAISFFLAFASMIGFIAGAVATDAFFDGTFNSGYVMMQSQTKYGNTWKYKFSSASDGYKATKTYKIDDTSKNLYVEITCEGEDLLLYLQQNGKEEVYNLSEVDGMLVIPLDQFETGKVKAVIEIKGARNAKMHAYIDV